MSTRRCCKEVRHARAPVVIDHASQDEVYCTHHTPRIYAIESYVSVPIVLSDGAYFGNLCAIDPRPAKVSDEKTLSTFILFAQLVALELENQRRSDSASRALLIEREGGALREQFIAVLGHDLRTPLSAVAACGQLLSRLADNPDKVRDLASRITANVDRMTLLISDVLDFARGRLGGGLQIGAEPIDDLSGAILEVIEELREGMPDRRIDADVEIKLPVRGDRIRLQQLVSNLVANALAHGDLTQPVAVQVSTGAGQLEIRVHNEGEPIPVDSLGQIFGPFWRNATAGASKGLGLGLHICEQIVKAHGGSLQVESTREAGTTFVARLPADDALPH